MDLKITAVASGVFEGERGTRGNAVPLNIFGGRRSPKDVRTRGTIINYNNAKYIVKVNSSVIKVKRLILCIVICIGKSVIHQLKLNIVTALFILLLLPHEFIYSILVAHDSRSA